MTRRGTTALFEFNEHVDKWTGGKALAIREPGCPECQTPLICAVVDQPALFVHGGYGATRRTTWAICPSGECRWTFQHSIEEIRPDRRTP